VKVENDKVSLHCLLVIFGDNPYNRSTFRPRGIQMAEANNGSMIMGMIWMLVLSLLLFWLPAFGSLIAGIVGGKVAGGVGSGILAALLPGILLALALFFGGTMLTAMPVIGAVIAGGGLLLYVFYIPPLLIGALIGGLMA
jgi:MFS family permease